MNKNHFMQREKNLFYHNMLLGITIILILFKIGMAQEQLDPMAATVLPYYQMIEQSLISLADAMPAEKYEFKPTEGEFTNVRTFGEQVKHVACANFAFFNQIEKKEPPAECWKGGPDSAETKEELMKYLKDSFEYTESVLKTMTPYGGESTRIGLTTLAIWHVSDHYGQLVVYLRMNGIVPPASRPKK